MSWIGTLLLLMMDTAVWRPSRACQWRMPGLPLALGAKAAQPGAPVVCIAGHGGFGHLWAELETAVRERLPVTVTVLNSSILGFQKHVGLYSFGAYTSAIDFCSVDHAAIARAIGAIGLRIEAAARNAAAQSQHRTIR